MAEFIKSLQLGPKEWEWGSVVSIVGSFLSHIVGWSNALDTLLLAMIIDYMTGIAGAYINPKELLNSSRGFKGVCKKVIILGLCALAFSFDRMLGTDIVFKVVVYFYIGVEGLSIIENAAKCGIPIPQKLRDTLEQLQSEKKS